MTCWSLSGYPVCFDWYWLVEDWVDIQFVVIDIDWLKFEWISSLLWQILAARKLSGYLVCCNWYWFVEDWVDIQSVVTDIGWLKIEWISSLLWQILVGWRLSGYTVCCIWYWLVEDWVDIQFVVTDIDWLKFEWISSLLWQILTVHFKHEGTFHRGHRLHSGIFCFQRAKWSVSIWYFFISILNCSKWYWLVEVWVDIQSVVIDIDWLKFSVDIQSVVTDIGWLKIDWISSLLWQILADWRLTGYPVCCNWY